MNKFLFLKINISVLKFNFKSIGIHPNLTFINNILQSKCKKTQKMKELNANHLIVVQINEYAQNYLNKNTKSVTK